MLNLYNVITKDKPVVGIKINIIHTPVIMCPFQTYATVALYHLKRFALVFPRIDGISAGTVVSRTETVETFDWF